MDGAPACPFVAFEDDRDGRALAPDHRHRCFAEPRPAPRALAHQEAYCLSSAFPVCPAFQDWARREAAAARPAARPPASPDRQPRDVPPVSAYQPPREPEPGPASDADDLSDPAPRRNPHRDWAAPPPWAGDPGMAPPQAVSASAAAAAQEPDPYRGTRSSDSQGLAGSQADRLAGPEAGAPVSARQPSSPTQDDPDDWAGAGVAAVAAAGATASRAQAPSKSTRYEAQRPDARYNRRNASARQVMARGAQPKTNAAPNDDAHVQQDAVELFGPAWEKPRRYEAYPSLRTRIGLPGVGGIPRLAVAAIAVVLAAVVLFFVGPMLLGIGGRDHGTGGASPTPVASGQASTRPAATPAPAPTSQVYVVAKGDTMLKIAKKYGLTVQQLQAANPKIKNPNKIGIGDQIIIPAPTTGDSAGGSPGSSSAP